MVQFYTLEEVKLRNGENGARTWIILHDCVYDATDYLKDVRKFNSNLIKFFDLMEIVQITNLASGWW